MSGFVFSRKPITIERGAGVHLYDPDGTAYLDAGASYACTPVGHCHPAVVETIVAQAETLLYVQGSYPTAPRDALYDRLSAIGPDDCDRVWLCNSGTEANEAALKFARSATGREHIVAATRGFHGRTLGALSATWREQYKAPFEPLVGGIDFVPYGDQEALAAAVDADTAAVILEPIQGEGGVHPAPPGYLSHAREVTDAAGAALVFDEIQTGMGRTGSMWACDHEGVVPDILTSAKGIASGLPLGATLCREWVAESSGPHGSTFSGNPLVAAAATATLDVIEADELPAKAASVGSYLIDELETAALPIRDVRGRGCLVGIQVRRGANRVLRDLALDHQILALPAGRSVVRFLPPLVFDREHADELVAALAAILGEDDDT